MLNNDKLVQDFEVVVAKKAWHKPDVVVIEDTSATKASKPSNVSFESSAMWGIS